MFSHRAFSPKSIRILAAQMKWLEEVCRSPSCQVLAVCLRKLSCKRISHDGNFSSLFSPSLMTFEDSAILL